MFKEINEDFVIRTLQNYTQYSAANHEEMRQLYAILALQQSGERKEDIIMTVSLGRIMGMVPLADTNNNVRDLSDIYGKFDRLYMEDINITRSRIDHLRETQETMNRIMACYRSLSPSKEYLVLMYLYEKCGSYTVGMVRARSELYMGETTIKRHRKKGLARIKKMYGSDLTNTEMILTTGGIGGPSYK